MEKNGIGTIPARGSVDEVVERVEELLRAKQVKLFAMIDHSGEAAGAGLEMRPTKLLVFGNPKAGTPLMVAAPSMAIDLPLKILVWEDADGKTWISWNAPSYLQERHGLPRSWCRTSRWWRRWRRRRRNRGVSALFPDDDPADFERIDAGAVDDHATNHEASDGQGSDGECADSNGSHGGGDQSGAGGGGAFGTREEFHLPRVGHFALTRMFIVLEFAREVPYGNCSISFRRAGDGQHFRRNAQVIPESRKHSDYGNGREPEAGFPAVSRHREHHVHGSASVEQLGRQLYFSCVGQGL